MSTLIERLKEVMEAAGITGPQHLADVSGVSRSAAAQWLGQGSKIIHSIGNMEAAERLERASGYAALWIAKGVGPKHASKKEKQASGWPFSRVDGEKIQRLSPAEQEKLESALILAADLMKLNIKKD